MRAQRIIVRAALVCGLAGTAWCAWTILDEHAALANDRPAMVTQQPGGLLGPVEDVVDEVLPDPPAEPKPTETEAPEQEQADEPTEAPEQATPPAEKPPTDDRPRDPAPVPTPTPSTPPASPTGGVLDGVKDGLEDATEIITTPPPPPPVVVPTPTPTATPSPTLPTRPAPVVTSPAVSPVPIVSTPAAPVIAAPASAGLPVVIGPLPGRGTLILDDGIYPAEESLTAGPADCDGQLVEVAPESEGKPATVHYPPSVPAATDGPRRGRPCPGEPGAAGVVASGITAVMSVQNDLLTLLLATVPAGPVAPTLQRLYQLLPRAALPAGRTTHLDPRPA